MASKNLIFSKHGEEEDDEQQTLDEADGETFHETDEESDSDSESEEEDGTAVVPPKKPKFSLPRVEEGHESGEDGSECSSPSASAFIIMPAAKPSEKKKTPASKKFSDEDEIALLKGLAVFWANGRNNKWTEFHLFIKDDLPHLFTKIQVSEKIRGLKRKFEANFERARANGGCLDFSDSHESLLFELSKTLWGDEKSIAHETRKRTGNEHDEEKKIPKKLKQVVEVGNENFESAYPLLYASFDVFGYPKIVKENCFLIGREKAQELEEKWRELKAEELRLELKKIDLIKRDLQDHLRSK
ncbi:hypothetical protein Pfo_024527 [Paulownia fortunei]|nr:hypothetical protein Pfo_024527 [Paulownia fortunei]